MRNHVTKTTIYVLIMILGTLSVANAGALRFPSGSQQPLSQVLKYDGIWAAPGNVTLIKQLDGYVILQGKDKASTWWARCVINGNKLTCRVRWPGFVRQPEG